MGTLTTRSYCDVEMDDGTTCGHPAKPGRTMCQAHLKRKSLGKPVDISDLPNLDYFQTGAIHV